MKPVIRWTIGNIYGTVGYQILYFSIKSILHLYGNQFNYFVFYNEVNLNHIEKLKKKFKQVNFLEQKWEDCPINLLMPNVTDPETRQKLNGSFWKICPPRIANDVHEIILDNDLVFLKRPEAIEEFLSRTDKNFIIQDSKLYLGSYRKYIKERQGYNSGVMGLRPNYDFSSELIENWNSFDRSGFEFNYGEEQGLLVYTLFKSGAIVGTSEDFVGLHPDCIYLNSLRNHIAAKFGVDHHKVEMDEDRTGTATWKYSMLNDIVKDASVIHFLRSNRDPHMAWPRFKNINLKMM